MKTLSQFLSEAYDAEFRSGAQVRKQGEGGRIRPERKKSATEIIRSRAVGGGKMEPVGPYKPRKDIGSQKTAAERQQQPEQERGSKEVAQSYAEKVKAERRAAAQARAAAKKGGSAATTEKPKAKPKDLSCLLYTSPSPRDS